MCYCAFTLETWGIIMTLCRLLSFRIITDVFDNEITVSSAMHQRYLTDAAVSTSDKAWVCIVVLIALTGVFALIFM